MCTQLTHGFPACPRPAPVQLSQTLTANNTNFIINRLRLPAKAQTDSGQSGRAEAPGPQSPCSWAQGPVEAGLAAWAGPGRLSLAKAHQQAVDFSPTVPCRWESSVWREGRGSRREPLHPILGVGTPGQPLFQSSSGFLWGPGCLLGPPESVGDSVHMCVHCCLEMGAG